MRWLEVITFLFTFLRKNHCQEATYFITHGNHASEGQFPFQVYIKSKFYDEYKESYGVTSCGGSLISHWHVITAAHCMTLDHGENPLKVKILLGTLQIEPDKSSTRKPVVRYAKRIMSHEKYDGFRHDIALIKMNRFVRYSNRIQKARIEKFYPDPGTILQVSGWGYVTHDLYQPVSKLGKLSNDLLFVDTKVISNRKCLRENISHNITFDAHHKSEVFDEMICAKGVGGPCSGDSGGPLSLDSLQLIGIVMTSVGTEFVCFDGYPAVYTRVAPYINWIKRKMRE